jgi:hypothetical protein
MITAQDFRSLALSQSSCVLVLRLKKPADLSGRAWVQHGVAPGRAKIPIRNQKHVSLLTSPPIPKGTFMAKSNYFISYDLNSPGQDYTKIAKAIGELGISIRAQKSMFYLRSALTQQQVFDAVWAAMDRNDSLLVISASNAIMKNLLPGAQDFILKNWNV